MTDVPVAGVSVCHCYMCQRWSGGLFATFDAPANAVSVTGAVMHHRSSHLSERAFCPKCGSNLWIRDHADDADFELIAGIFPDAATFPLISEIYIDQAPAYVPLAGDHPRKTADQYEATNPFVKGDTP
ncbi:GFA family protein [Rhodobacteraceae bacterium KMM 6894]|nr:GFA family protein [Rhodobacteraceae bacterium KMM 6894]